MPGASRRGRAPAPVSSCYIAVLPGPPASEQLGAHARVARPAGICAGASSRLRHPRGVVDAQHACAAPGAAGKRSGPGVKAGSQPALACGSSCNCWQPSRGVCTHALTDVATHWRPTTATVPALRCHLRLHAMPAGGLSRGGGGGVLPQASHLTPSPAAFYPAVLLPRGLSCPGRPLPLQACVELLVCYHAACLSPVTGGKYASCPAQVLPAPPVRRGALPRLAHR